MRYTYIFALLLASCAHSQSKGHTASHVAPPERWKITLISIHAPKTPAKGETWDADKSPPDISGKLIVGRFANNKCSELVTQDIPKQTNTYDAKLSVSASLDNIAGQPTCFTLKLFDGDMLKDDLMGTVTAMVREGDMVVTAGAAQARLSIVGAARR